jgi:nitroimidazol reductase NimA-like FMN-containing flavoprotein (pyridoxamine 5'-phosphate oxidase superfamily)
MFVTDEEDRAMSKYMSLDHAGLGVLSHEECLHQLRRAQVGRIAFVENGEPVILPVNHGLDGEVVVFRTAPGAKLFAAEAELPVAFEVDGYDVDRRSGWSVVLRGTATAVENPEDVARLNLLGVEPWADLAERKNWVRIRAFSMTGRQVVHPYRA